MGEDGGLWQRSGELLVHSQVVPEELYTEALAAYRMTAARSHDGTPLCAVYTDWLGCHRLTVQYNPEKKVMALASRCPEEIGKFLRLVPEIEGERRIRGLLERELVVELSDMKKLDNSGLVTERLTYEGTVYLLESGLVALASAVPASVAIGKEHLERFALRYVDELEKNRRVIYDGLDKTFP